MLGTAAVLGTAVVGLCVLLVVHPSVGLTVTWGYAAPALPLVFLLAPSGWRNICPLTLANQLPRAKGFGGQWELPASVAARTFPVAALGFVALVLLRRLVLDHSGPATAAVLAAGLLLAFAGGVLFRGKSGWCGTVCPLYAAQRIYGRAPAVKVTHAHCQPCVGCVRRCVDANPSGVASFENSAAGGARPAQVLVGAAPGLVVGYFAVPSLVPLPVVGTVLAVLVPAVASAGVYLLLARVGRAGAARGARVDFESQRRALGNAFTATTFGLFYVFAGPRFLDPLGWDSPWADTVVQVCAVAGAVTWWLRGRRAQEPATAAASTSASPVVPPATAASSVVRFVGPDGNRQVGRIRRGQTLADAARACGSALPEGCGAGTCGADPVTVVAGRQHLSPPTPQERATLRRLNVTDGTRLACVAQVRGEVTVTTRPPVAAPPGGVDAAVRSVVVVGNGIAGLTTADWVRRLHPASDVHLIGREPHHTYNRMALTDLVTGDAELTKLGLLPDGWFDEHRITAHVGTAAVGLDLAGRTVTLEGGERLDFDRLVLATGASPAERPIDGLPLPGAQALYTAEQALAVRNHAKSHPDLRTAVVVGAGPLGIEVAVALAALGLSVHLVDRHHRLARRLVDAPVGRLIETTLERLGVTVHKQVTVRWVGGMHRVHSVGLSDRQRIPCDLLLMCTGSRPDVSLAREAGLYVRTGVVVDHTMRSSHPAVFAVGDAAEHPDGVSGLWYAAVEQAEVAAEQAVALDPLRARRYLPGPAVTRFGLPGLEIVSVGRTRVLESDTTSTVLDDIVLDEAGLGEAPRGRYVKTVVAANGTVVGGVVVNDPGSAVALESLAQKGVDVRDHLPRLRAGDLAGVDALGPRTRRADRRAWTVARR